MAEFSSDTVSVLMVVNGAHDIPGLLQSVLGQTVKPTEIILAVNPSDFNSKIEGLTEHQSVRTWVPDRDTNVGGLLRGAAESATGKYLTWMRSNFVLDPRKIERQLSALHRRPEDEAIVVSTGVRDCAEVIKPSGIARPAVVEFDKDPVSVLVSLLNESRQPEAILASRACVDAVGGFDASYGVIPEFDLAARLAGRFPFVHVDASLIRRAFLWYPLNDSARKEEMSRVWEWMLEQAPSMDATARLFCALGRNASAMLPLLRDRIALLVDEQVLSVVVMGSADPSVDHTAFMERLGVPRAAFLVSGSARDRNEIGVLLEAALSTDSEWVMTVSASAPPLDSDTLALQLLQVVGAQLDACLAGRDTIVYQPMQPQAKVTGTLFRRSALARLRMDRNAEEVEFWNAFGSSFRIGALPAVEGVARPASRPAPVVTVKPKVAIADLAAAAIDRVWYLHHQPDVAHANVDPVHHYLTYGWRERRDPNAWLNSAWYLQQYPHLEASGINPLQHFFENDNVEALGSRPGFDLRWTLRSQLGAKPATFESLLNLFLPTLDDLAGRSDVDLSREEAQREIETIAPRFIGRIRALAAEDLSIHEKVVALIDPAWYLETYTDVAHAQVDPIQHYLTHGWRERRDPNPWSATNWYIDQNPDALQSDRSAVEHFIRKGAASGKNPHPGFNLSWYMNRYLPGSSLGSDILLHFLRTGEPSGALPNPRLDRGSIRRELEGLPPSQRPKRIRQVQSQLGDESEILRGLIDGGWYRAVYRDVADANVDAVEHYLNFGWRERRDPSAWFHTSWYLSQNSDVAALGICPLLHYMRDGAAEGRRPCAGFDPVWYATRYLDAGSPSVDALTHFLGIGLLECAVPDPALNRPDISKRVAECPVADRTALLYRLGRIVKAEEEIATALMDPVWYEGSASSEDRQVAMRHYRDIGWREGLNPNQWFDTQWYLAQNPDVRKEDICPLDHFVRVGAAKGRRPHPMFDIESYARKYLSGSKPIAEALLHFMNIGLDKGASPDPRLATPAVRKRLLDIPVSERPAFLQRMLAVLSSSSPQSHRWKEAEADLWPALLTRNFPDNTVSALLLCGNTAVARDQARAASMALPVEEFALFGFLESDSELRLSDSPGDGALSVTFVLPKELNALKTLLTALPCRRAAAVESGLMDTGIVRAVRNAGVPVTTRE